MRGFQVLGSTPFLDVIHPRLERRMRAGFRKVGDPRRHGVQVDVRTRRQQRRFIDENDSALVRAVFESYAYVADLVEDKNRWGWGQPSW